MNVPTTSCRNRDSIVSDRDAEQTLTVCFVKPQVYNPDCSVSGVGMTQLMLNRIWNACAILKILKLLYPICNKHICITSAAVISIATPNNFFPIWRKHGKGIKRIAVSDR